MTREEAGGVQEAVRRQYGAAAASGLSSRDDGVRAVAAAFGYSNDELASIPAEANLGLSCGNPTATAHLRPGETVVDLGSGGGLDVFLAAKKVGPTGKAIGVDMTPAMIELAKRNAATADDGRPAANVEFHLAPIDALPLADATVDCVLSNCVINLAADKPAVFREIARVLKPGGRLAVSDIALKKPLPPELAADVAAYVGCIAGAISIDDYKFGLLSAGFAEVEVVDAGADLNAYANVENQAACCTPTIAAPTGLGRMTIVDAGCCTPSTEPMEPGVHERLTELLGRYDVNEYAASVKVYAVKPA
ncbi:MAG: arsenite methyltransferase [Planctomycetia bacterium]